MLFVRRFRWLTSPLLILFAVFTMPSGRYDVTFIRHRASVTDVVWKLFMTFAVVREAAIAAETSAFRQPINGRQLLADDVELPAVLSDSVDSSLDPYSFEATAYVNGNSSHLCPPSRIQRVAPVTSLRMFQCDCNCGWVATCVGPGARKDHTCKCFKSESAFSILAALHYARAQRLYVIALLALFTCLTWSMYNGQYSPKPRAM